MTTSSMPLASKLSCVGAAWMMRWEAAAGASCCHDERSIATSRLAAPAAEANPFLTASGTARD
jgi:hypothetical protein